MVESLTVNVGEAKTRLSSLIALTERGCDVVIARQGKPAVRLVPVEPRHREFGFMKLGVSDSALFEPMTREEMGDWHDGPVFPEDTR